MGKKLYEKDIIRAGLKILNALPMGVYKKRSANINNAGEPDITGCQNGYRVEIEVKLPGKPLTALQEKNLAKWASAGAITGVARSSEDFKKIMAPHIDTDIAA